MPSPFPGMDPWLEGEMWMDVHNQFSAEIARQLSPKLLPKDFARAVRRNVIDVAHVTIEIRDARQRELMTAMRSCRRRTSAARDTPNHLEKRGRLLNSTAHLVEIDLLRAGRRVPMREPLPESP